MSKRASYTGCSSTQQSQISSAISSGQSYASSSYSHLTSNPSGSTRYTRWFGTFSTSRYNAVLNSFSRLRTYPNGWTYNCNTCSDPDTYAYVYPSRYGTVYLCGYFWSAPATGAGSRADTIIHEGTHFTQVLGTDDYVYGQSGCLSLAKSNPTNAVYNADFTATYKSVGGEGEVPETQPQYNGSLPEVLQEKPISLKGKYPDDQYIWGNLALINQLSWPYPIKLWTSFSLTVDLVRANTYLGCIAVQSGNNATFLVLGLILCPIALQKWLQGAGTFPVLLFSTPSVVAVISTLVLLGIILWPVSVLRSHLPMKDIWRTDTKDAFQGLILSQSRPNHLSMFGHPRNAQFRRRFIQSAAKTGRAVKTAIAAPLFRRIRCIGRDSNVRVHSQHILSDRNTSSTISSHHFTPPGREPDCNIHKILTQPLIKEYRGSNKSWLPELSVRASHEDSSAVFHIEVKWNNKLTRALEEDHMPFVWVLKSEELSSNFSSPEANAARRLVDGWTLRPGSHIQAEAKLITRALITSSVLRDIFFKASVSINNNPLVLAMESLATAIIRATLRPGFTYFQTQKDLPNPELPHRPAGKCDFVEDYRSGTVFDVIGSVGGLFALLHAVHVLFFGRPLLWGLTGWSRSIVKLPPPHSTTYAGAKLITPFGLIGRCSSARFKSRLRREYHEAPTEDSAGTIQIVKFLRDFVIDFGPAGLDWDEHSSDEHMDPKLPIDSEGTTSARIPLMDVESDATNTQQSERGSKYELQSHK
ncbi:deuterolysin metalloprotease (M35) family domain-containing protein [Rhizoctonia solani AG-1 IA]|uniref:Deuterolysin metalloprotease (M35) family domain-containing protein n=1 Tax=Thanatephorus cucumeris (strain AG1-IA) TaxID=983506 RepID=L8WG02_THACA|nr:deuterolysin metalloprotease (M35) family domain-containing protein [Rhizoctonia solani AG-1 IA]